MIAPVPVNAFLDSAALLASGVYLLLRARTFPVILGLTLISHAVNLFLFSMGRLALEAPPVIGEGRLYADPLPQALVLTAIVIGFGVIAFTLVLRRLRGRARDDRGLGVAVLLRYTLRLLTLDQLGRVSARLRELLAHPLAERRGEILHRGKPIPRLFRDRLEADSVQFIIDAILPLRWRLGLARENLRRHRVGGPVERQTTGEQFVEYDSEAINVSAGTDRLPVAAHLLRFSTNSRSRVHYSPRPDEDILFQIDGSHFRLYDAATDPAPIHTKLEASPPSSAVEEEEVPPTPSEFAYESDLRDFLAKLSIIEPGLQLYEEEGITGVEFPVGGRFVDILGVDSENRLVVIELKVSRGYDRVVGQLLRYMAWINEHQAEPGQGVRGVIVAREISEDLKLACSTIPNVALFEYELSVVLRNMEI